MGIREKENVDLKKKLQLIFPCKPKRLKLPGGSVVTFCSWSFKLALENCVRRKGGHAIKKYPERAFEGLA